MQYNDMLIRVKIHERNTGMGYTKKSFRKTGDIYKVDKQPYSPELAKKQYGLSDENIKYRCFTEKQGLKAGDYVSCKSLFYLVLLAHDWDKHSELILGAFKNG